MPAIAKEQKESGEAEDEEDDYELAPVGPGGLDPNEVFPTLPEEWQKAFEAKDTGMLRQAVNKMSIEDAKYHIKRCEKSGIWVAGPAADAAPAAAPSAADGPIIGDVLREASVLGEALYSACYYGVAHEVRCLLSRGTDVNDADEGGSTPLMAASQNGQVEVVDMLLAAEANVHAAGDDGGTALHVASLTGQLVVASLSLWC
jgi:hypothetical protein